MKKFVKWIIIVCGCIVVCSALIYFLAIKPINDEEAVLKPLMLASTDEFTRCLENNIPLCYEKMTTDRFKSSVNLEQFTKYVGNLNFKLGKRLSSELVDEKFNMLVSVGSNAGKRIFLTVREAYQKDLMVIESYGYTFDEKLNEYKLDSVTINSDRLVE